MSEQYLHRVLSAVDALLRRGEPITIRAIQRVMGLAATHSSGTTAEALHELRARGYVDFCDGCVGTLRSTEPRLYE